ncbi:Uncharacterized protein ALO94_05590 [Pseudomonas syringae pv. spinaceae]|uniref:Uncharacterized protein n=1 Tax=Pseudomonas syringae pv. spinaceae TaxID=264459 RepID=A0A0Q0C2Q6_PSESX|nr:Uncharacterized protein ALO94_05590 [Pseudomonas syringae pv. spinaceae]
MRIGRRFEADGDFSAAGTHALACAQIKRHAHPAPVVDHDLERHIGFRRTVRLDPIFLAITDNLLVAHRALRILTAYRIGQCFLFVPRPDRAHHLGFFATDRVGTEGRGGLHRDHRQQLEQVIGHHVAQCTGVLVKTATGLDTHGFRGGDLHVVDVVVVTERLEQAIGETADQNVLHRLLAQVMVDPVDLFFAHDLEQAAIERHCTGQIGAERLFDNYPAEPVIGFLQQTGRPQALGHFAEEPRRGGQIKHRIFRTGALDLAGDVLIGRIIEKVTLHIADTLGQRAPQRRIERVLATAGNFAGGLVANEIFEFFGEVRIADRVMIDADDVQPFIHQTVARQVVKRRHQQTLDQVTMCTEQKQGGWGRNFGFLLGTAARQTHYLGSLWPPNPKRMADSILSAYELV